MPDSPVARALPRQRAGTQTSTVTVLVIGIPGAGKTTLIDRACTPDWTVLDTDRLRRRMPRALRHLPVPYVLYVVAIVAAILRQPKVVVQSRGTYTWLRRLVTACARVRGRAAVLVMLDAPASDAMAGQVSRGRVAPSRVMRWHIARWSHLLDAGRGGALAAEGWTRVVVLDRARASAVDSLDELTCDGYPPDGKDSPDQTSGE